MGELRKLLFIEYCSTVFFAILAYLVSIWFLIGVVYILTHFMFGPLDWYLLYKLYTKLRR